MSVDQNLLNRRGIRSPTLLCSDLVRWQMDGIAGWYFLRRCAQVRLRSPRSVVLLVGRSSGSSLSPGELFKISFLIELRMTCAEANLTPPLKLEVDDLSLGLDDQAVFNADWSEEPFNWLSMKKLT